MSKFGQTLFGGGGFIRWTLSPFVLLFAVVMPLVIDEWTFGRVVLVSGMELMCFCLLAGFWLPSRIGFWAFRLLAGMVAIAYAAYLVHEFFFADKSFNVTGRRSDASPFNLQRTSWISCHWSPEFVVRCSRQIFITATTRASL